MQLFKRHIHKEGTGRMEDNVALAEGMHQIWNWLCGVCGWRGVAQDLATDDNTDEWWVCPKCNSTNIQDIGWHKGNKKHYE